MAEKIKALQTIHLALCGGAIFAYIFIGQISIDTLMFSSIESSEIIFFAIPVLALFLSNFLFRQQLKQTDPKAKPEDKLGIYQTASLIRYAVLEGAAFAILFAAPKFLVLGILLLLYLLFLRPTEQRIISDFQNSGQ